MTEGNGQGVGGIRRPGRFVEAQQTGQHHLHLFLVGRTVAGDRCFHRGRHVFEDRYAGLGSGEEGDSGRPTHRDRSLEIAVGEDGLDGDDVGAGLGYQIGESSVDLGEPRSGRLALVTPDDPGENRRGRE